LASPPLLTKDQIKKEKIIGANKVFKVSRALQSRQKGGVPRYRHDQSATWVEIGKGGVDPKENGGTIISLGPHLMTGPIGEMDDRPGPLRCWFARVKSKFRG